MHARVVDWPDQRIGLELELGRDEIEPLIENLDVLRRDSEQHFHLSSDGPEIGRVGDIEISVMAPGRPSNLSMTSVALPPGTEVRSPRNPRPWRLELSRRGFSVLLAAVGLVELLGAAAAAYVTYITDDYRPILIRGVWDAAAALIAFQASGLLARGWKARVATLVGALAVLVPLREILHRLGAFR